MNIIKIFCNFDDFCKNAEIQYSKEQPTETPDRQQFPVILPSLVKCGVQNPYFATSFGPMAFLVAALCVLFC